MVYDRKLNPEVMPINTNFPLLFQVNTRVNLKDAERTLGRKTTLDDFPEAELTRYSDAGFNWIWMLSVWQTGAIGREISRKNPEWRTEFKQTLPDLKEEDIPGSGFAITGYDVHEDLGGDAALARLRSRLKSRGMKLLLDFVPNHSAIDHPWVESHPEYYIEGNDELLATQPANYIRLKTKKGSSIFAYGRDPYFAGWPDTLQLNYGNADLQEAMIQELLRIADRCDGVRCDMAMLVLPDVFERTWQRPSAAFWSNAIGRVKERHPGFLFVAEAYWDLEWRLQQEGFDYTYDKTLYDRLREGSATHVREHFYAQWGYQVRSARFLENHDEPRAASVFPHKQHEAAAVITFLSPGLRFFHLGQLKGKQHRISPHLGRGPDEPVDGYLESFYKKLLTILRQNIFHMGNWQLLEVGYAGTGHQNFIGFGWSGQDNERALVVVNYSPHQSQCMMRIPYAEMAGNSWILVDQFTGTRYLRDGNDLVTHGLYLDEPGWKIYVFSVERMT
jgi:glycosidase